MESNRSPKLILVEGIPGSGKSTTAERIGKYLEEKHIDSRLFLEGNFNNPTDFAWTAVFTQNEYQELLRSFPAWSEKIDEHSSIWRGMYLVCYQKLKAEENNGLPESLLNIFAAHEPYDGKIAPDEFRRMHIERARDFVASVQTGDEVFVFESSFLQNQINELLAYGDLAEDMVISHLKGLCREFLPLNPMLIYLAQTDVEKTISRVAMERISSDKSGPDWIDMVVEYITKSPYGRCRGLHGFEGAVEYFSVRRGIELRALTELPCVTVTITNDDYDADSGIARVLASLPY